MTDAADMVSFKSISNTLYKRRRLCLTKVPSDATELATLIGGCGLPLPQYMSIKDGNTVIGIIFYSEEMVRKIISNPNSTNTIHFDGTFYTVPKIFYQLFTVFININGYGIPAFHCLMISKQAAHLC